MQELFSNPEGIVAFIAALFGGSTGIGAIITAIINGRTNKKYSAQVAAANAKDKQIEELKEQLNGILQAVSLLVSAFATQQLSSLALPAEVKKQIVAITAKIEEISGIKLDSAVHEAIRIMTSENPMKELEAKKEEIVANADVVKDKLKTAADNLIDSIPLG